MHRISGMMSRRCHDANATWLMLFSFRLRHCTFKMHFISKVVRSHIVSWANQFEYFSLLFSCCPWIKNSKLDIFASRSRVPTLSFNMRFLSRFPRCLIQPQMSSTFRSPNRIINTKEGPMVLKSKGNRLQHWNGRGLFFHTQRNYRVQCVIPSIFLTLALYFFCHWRQD